MIREGGSTGDAEGGWIEPNSETITACGEKNAKGEAYGFCLPAGRTATQITFGGRNEFLHLGDFIQYIFRYSIVIAGILATFMMIIAGFQWATSAGGDGISEAKQKISNALIGLILAVSSYFILNLINPYLVQLRLPQVWLIKSQEQIPAVCTQIQGAFLLAEAKKQGQQLSSDQTQAALTEAEKTNSFTLTPKQAPCGADYFVKGQGTQTCQGTFCPKLDGRTQICFPSPGNQMQSTCQKGNIAGTIYNSSLSASSELSAYIGEDWGVPWVKATPPDTDIALTFVCNDGKYDHKWSLAATTLTTLQDNPPMQVYKQTVDVTEALNKCGPRDNLRGFLLRVNMNEQFDVNETHYIGKSGNTAVDLGDNGVFSGASNQIIPTVVSQQYLITPEDLQNGIILNINAADIHDIDSEADRKLYYGYLGYK